MMKKNMIIRKRHFVSMAMLCVALGISGCGSQLTVENYTHEAGEALPEEAAAYVDFKNTDQKEAATVDLSKVDPKKVGSYEAVIVLDEKEYPFTVDVVDTKAPEGTFQQLVVACGIDQTVIPEWFECSGTDASEFQYGIRKAELLKTAEELKEIIQANIKEAEDAGVEQLMLRDLAGVAWNEETDTWDEFGISAAELKSEFVPEEEGLWRLEILSVDEYGNADVFYGYVIADLEAPVFTQTDDLNVKSSNNLDEYMASLNDGLKVEDNLLGDITYQVEVTGTENIDDKNLIGMKVNYKIMDLAGNETEASRNLIYGEMPKVTTTEEKEIPDNGYDRAKAEQAFALVNQQRTAAGLNELVWEESLYDFACTRSEQIVSDFSHNLPDGTGVSHYLLNNVGGAMGYGENIAKNYKSVNNLVNAWMNSQGHKENILDSRYTAGVMACYYYNGGYYWVNLFKAQ